MHGERERGDRHISHGSQGERQRKARFTAKETYERERSPKGRRQCTEGSILSESSTRKVEREWPWFTWRRASAQHEERKGTGAGRGERHISQGNEALGGMVGERVRA